MTSPSDLTASAREWALLGAREAAKIAADASFEIGRREHEPQSLKNYIQDCRTGLAKAQDALSRALALCELASQSTSGRAP